MPVLVDIDEDKNEHIEQSKEIKENGANANEEIEQKIVDIEQPQVMPTHAQQQVLNLKKNLVKSKRKHFQPKQQPSPPVVPPLGINQLVADILGVLIGSGSAQQQQNGQGNNPVINWNLAAPTTSK
jgi:hypothetical protein